MIKSIFRTIRQHSNYEGRSNRKEFLYFQIFSFPLAILAFGALFFIFKSVNWVGESGDWKLMAILSILILVALLFLAYLQCAIYVRRFHDINLPGVWFWLYLILAVLQGLFGGIFINQLTSGIMQGEMNSYLQAHSFLAIITFCYGLGIFLLCCIERGDPETNKYGEVPD